jgi:hypothetical protein
MENNNKLNDLHDILFETLEGLVDRKLDGEVFKQEVIRARAVAEIAEQIVKNGMLIAALNRLTDNSTANMKSARLLLE